MNTYMTEDEQVEAIKRWWSNYGNHVLSVVLIILLAVVGTKWYRQHRYSIKSQASTSYEQLIQQFSAGDETGVTAQSQYLVTNYPDTVYAEGSALMLARLAVYQGKPDEAIKQLQWVNTHADLPALKQVARLRLARLYSMQKKFDDAFSILNDVIDPSFLMLVHETKGDIYMAQGKRGQAREQYELAIKELPKDNVVSPELKMKLNHVTSRAYHLAKKTAHLAPVKDGVS